MTGIAMAPRRPASLLLRRRRSDQQRYGNDAAARPGGWITASLSTLRSMLARSTTLQARIAGGTEAARTRIHFAALPPSNPGAEEAELKAALVAARPFIIMAHEQAARQIQAYSVSHDFTESGAILMQIEENVPTAFLNDFAAAYLHFVRFVENILDDVARQAGTPGNLLIQTIEHVAWERAHPDLVATQGDFMTADVRITWGVGGNV